MRRINLISATEWDDLELLEADAGKFLRNPENAENIANYRRISASYPRVEMVEVVAGDDSFSVSPAAGQARDQLALGSLYRIARSLGWRVSNIVKRFDPILAADVAKRYGLKRLGYRSSWLKVTIPASLRVVGAQQDHPETVRYMIEAIDDRESVMSMHEFRSLSARSIAKPMPTGQASQYLEAMGVR